MKNIEKGSREFWEQELVKLNYSDYPYGIIITGLKLILYFLIEWRYNKK